MLGCFRRFFVPLNLSKKKTVRPSWYESWKDENFRLLFWFDSETHQKCFSELDLDVCKRHIWMFWGPKQKDQDDGHKSVGSNHGCLVQRNQGGASSLESLLECCGGGSIFLVFQENSTDKFYNHKVENKRSALRLKNSHQVNSWWGRWFGMKCFGQQNTGKCVGKTGNFKAKRDFLKVSLSWVRTSFLAFISFQCIERWFSGKQLMAVVGSVVAVISLHEDGLQKR